MITDTTTTHNEGPNLDDSFIDEEEGGECSGDEVPPRQQMECFPLNSPVSTDDDDELLMTKEQESREESDQEIVADFVLRRTDDSVIEDDSTWQPQQQRRQQQQHQRQPKPVCNEIDVDTMKLVVDDRATEYKMTTTRDTTKIQAGKVGGGGGRRHPDDNDDLPRKRRPEMEYDETAWQPVTTTRKAGTYYSVQEKLDVLGGEKGGGRRSEDVTCITPQGGEGDSSNATNNFVERKTGRRRCQENGESPQPGAYAGAPGQSLTRSLSPRYSLVGIQARLILEEEHTAEMCDTSTSEGAAADPSCSNTNKDPSYRIDVERGVGGGGNTNDGDDDEEGLAVAVPAQRPSQLQEAMEVDSAAIQKAHNKKGTNSRLVVCGVIAIVVVISAVALVSTLLTSGSNNEDATATTEHPSMSPSESPTVRMPPMDNLAILFDNLAENTKESLMDESTPQRKAWDWLLNHQNITNLPEWRKQQLFALATFFHSFEGPKWPQDIRKNWLNDTIEECSWINTSLRYLYGISATYLRSLTFDFNPCNSAGEYQTIALIYLKLARANPVMPPEIALLPNLAHLILALSEIRAPLSDVIIPELYQLSNLDMFVLHGNSISGSLPKDIGNLTSPRYLLFGTNSISGTIPTEVGLLTSRLWDLDLHVNNIAGTIPSELGQLTMVTSLTLNENSLEGPIPEELGNIPTMVELQLDLNSLTGYIPSSLGLLTLMKRLQLQGNQLSGSLPSEIFQLPDLKDLGLADLPLLSGEIPNDLCWLQANDTSCFVFESNAALPDSYMCSLSFDCSDLLCGCDCPCSTNQTNGTFLI